MYVVKNVKYKSVYQVKPTCIKSLKYIMNFKKYLKCVVIIKGEIIKIKSVKIIIQV